MKKVSDVRAKLMMVGSLKRMSTAGFWVRVIGGGVEEAPSNSPLSAVDIVKAK